GVFQLDGGVAAAADQELPLVWMFRMAAADEGVERSDAMDQAVLQQEIQRPVHRGRRSAAAILLAQYGQDVIGAQRLVALPDQLQHALAQCGEAHALARAERIGLGQRAADAMVVVVGGIGQWSLGHGQRLGCGETLLCYLFSSAECCPWPVYFY